MNSDSGESPISSETTRAPSRSLWRWPRRLALVLAFLPLLYLLGANLLLNTEVGREVVNRRPEKLSVAWDRAWSWVPGRVEVSGLRMRGAQKGALWALELDDATVSVRLQPLFSRQFETQWIRGSGLGFRHRLRPRPDRPFRRPEAMPPIPDPGPPSDLETGLSSKQARHPNKDPWRVRLDGIHIQDVREIWVDAYRFLGTGDLQAECRFEIRGPFEMPDGSLELQGELTSGEDLVAEEVDLAMEARLHPFVFGDHKGRAALRFLDGTARVVSPRASLGVLDQYFRGTEWLAIDGTGRLEAQAVLRHGELRPGTWLDATEGEFELDYLDFRATGTGQVRGEVAGSETSTATANLEARLETFELRRRGAQTPHIRGSGFEVRASSPSTDLVAPRTDFEASIDVPTSEIIDLTSYNTYIPASSGFRFTSGQATLEGQLELSTLTNSGRGNLLLQGKRVAATLGAVEIVGDLTLRSRLTDADPESRRFDLSGSQLELKQVLVKEPGADEASYWWAHFDLPEGKVRLGHPLELEARLEARIRDSLPIIALVAQKKPLLRWMRPILEVHDLNLRGGFEMVRESVIIEDLVLTGDGLEILADLEVVGREPSGAVFLRRGPFSASLALDEGESDWKVFGARKWFRNRPASSSSR